MGQAPMSRASARSHSRSCGRATRRAYAVESWRECQVRESVPAEAPRISSHSGVSDLGSAVSPQCLPHRRRVHRTSRLPWMLPGWATPEIASIA